MGLIQNQFCILLFALVFRCIAESDYFLQSEPLSWDEARAGCKACYDDLVTLTPDNTPTIVKNLTCGYYWIGLRRNLSSNDCHLPWSHWANGDPLAFQNWYPDWARNEPSPDHPDITTHMTTSAPVLTTHMTTSAPVLTTHMTTGAPVLTTHMTAGAMTTSMGGRPNLAKYCVAMASFGPWVKMKCSKLLPSFCYEDRFYGKVTVTEVTSSTATLTWLAHPSNISHYQINVNGTIKATVKKRHLTHDLSELTPGTLYFVQVIPVKCERTLSPQSDAFHTVPGMIKNLRTNSVTETSVSLIWSRPDGEASSYNVVVEGLPHKTVCDKEAAEINDLTAGNRYTFRVTTVVGAVLPRWGEAVTTTVYTKPGKVSDLRVTDNSGVSLALEWVPPVGNFSGYRVKVRDISTSTFLKIVDQTQPNLTVGDLPVGTELLITVTSLANGSVEGDSKSVMVHTAPAMISNLTVNVTADTLIASWSPPQSLHKVFIAELQMFGSNEMTTLNGTEATQTFNNLNSGTQYKVTIYTLNGEHKSKGKEESAFTLPQRPHGAKFTKITESSITLQWNPPKNSAVMYSVQMHSPFWGHTRSIKIGQPACTFDDLNSGTRYEFEVRTVAGMWESAPLSIEHSTVAKEREITLSMLCSSSQSLLCDKIETKNMMFEELKTKVRELLGENVFWKLEKKKE
ncbi:tenascin-R [Genypterus blacodes]|uniref:tenascin-R n=1 Tax=Genypterus blacodes TaxID=154954 RepID=UPI003F7735DE